MMQRYLFDRLTNPLAYQPNEQQARILWLRKAITEELQRLFSQRSFFAGMATNETASSQPSILNFGLSDLVSQTANMESVNSVTEQIRQMIIHYEPRLKSPVISLTSTQNPMQPAAITVSGKISAETLEEEFIWQSVVVDEEHAE